MRRATDWHGAAFRARQAAAFPLAERHAILRGLAERAADVVDEAGGVREAGGWTVVLQQVIGAQPDAWPNALGMATNPAWYRHRTLLGMANDIRNAACGLLHV